MFVMTCHGALDSDILGRCATTIRIGRNPVANRLP